MKTTTILSLALTALVSLAPLAHGRGIAGGGFHGGLAVGFRADAGFSASTHSSVRIGGRARSVSHNWDRSRDHFWGGHRYRFIDGDWFAFDFGLYPFDVDYLYDYNYDNGPGYTQVVQAPSVPLVAQVQGKLDRKGYNAGPANGQFSARTKAAIAQYQRDNRLPVTGTIGKRLLNSLRLS